MTKRAEPSGGSTGRAGNHHGIRPEKSRVTAKWRTLAFSLRSADSVIDIRVALHQSIGAQRDDGTVSTILLGVGRIKTYKEMRFATVVLDSGEAVMLSVSQEGIAIFKMRFRGLLPGPKIGEWPPNDLDRFLAKFGRHSEQGSPFRATAEFLASFPDVRSLQRYIVGKSNHDGEPKSGPHTELGAGGEKRSAFIIMGYPVPPSSLPKPLTETDELRVFALAGEYEDRFGHPAPTYEVHDSLSLEKFVAKVSSALERGKPVPEWTPPKRRP